MEKDDFAGVVLNNWYITNEIGRGAYGVICAGHNIQTGQLVAIKFEDIEKHSLKTEVLALQQFEGCSSICHLVHWGAYDKWNYIVMDLLGESLSELVRDQGGKFSLFHTLHLGIKALTCLEQVHSKGFVHRDIKPSNFVIGLTASSRKELYLIDFGLARKFVDDGVRDFSQFRGTPRYASINAHMCRDLGYRDDLWSLFYVLVEFATGSLPWKDLTDKDAIGEMKRTLNTPHFVSSLPPEFLSFMNYIKSLEPEQTIDYRLLKALLKEPLKKYPNKTWTGWEGVEMNARFKPAVETLCLKKPNPFVEQQESSVQEDPSISIVFNGSIIDMACDESSMRSPRNPGSPRGPGSPRPSFGSGCPTNFGGFGCVPDIDTNRTRTLSGGSDKSVSSTRVDLMSSQKTDVSTKWIGDFAPDVTNSRNPQILETKPTEERRRTFEDMTPDASSKSVGISIVSHAHSGGGTGGTGDSSSVNQDSASTQSKEYTQKKQPREISDITDNAHPEDRPSPETTVSDVESSSRGRDNTPRCCSSTCILL